MTVSGKLPVEKVNMVLEHEHVVTNFTGADNLKKPPLDKADALKLIIPSVNRVKQAGVNLLLECTPAYIGRDPELLKEMIARVGH